jgi:Flp pilus assembly protein TadB
MPDNFEKYKDELSRIDEQTRDELWTMPFATLVLLLFGVFAMTLLVNVVFYSFGHWILALLVYAVEIAALFFVLFNHRKRVDETLLAKISAMEPTHPGISEAFAKYRSKK